MGRGRRPNMALEPTRALQTQRAFRQRKAEHLANLEESVRTLTDENNKLRKLLNFEPRAATSPNRSSTSFSRSTSPSASHAAATQPRGGSGIPTPGPTGESSAAPGANAGPCDSCAGLQEANRQLAVAAAQVESQMSHLQASIKALRSVLQHHNIPIPSSADWPGTSSSPHPPPAKRVRTAEADNTHTHATPLAMSMTHTYFPQSSNSPAASAIHSTAAADQYARRPALPSTSSGQPWHTPSPSAILGAPTPPSASFSPRNAVHAAPSPAATGPEEGWYKSRPQNGRQGSISAGSGRQLPPPANAMSPARGPAPTLPPWTGSAGPYDRQSSNAARAAVSGASLRRDDGYGAAEHRYGYSAEYPPPQQQQGRSGYTSGSSPAFSGSMAMGSPAYTHHSPYDPVAQSVNSPRPRHGQSPRDRIEEPQPSIYARPSFSAQSYQRPSEAQRERSPTTESGACGPKKSCGPSEGKESSKCCPPMEKPASSCGPAGKCGPSKCGPSRKQDEDEAWTAPAPLGVSFDMRAGNGNGGKGEDDDECCLGLVKCDSEGRIII